MVKAAAAVLFALVVVMSSGCGESGDGTAGSGGEAGTGGNAGSGGSGGSAGTGSGGVGGTSSDVDAECRAFCQDSKCGGGDPVECLAECTRFAEHSCGQAFRDRVVCETELGCNDIFLDCDPLADAWSECFAATLPQPVEAACDIEYRDSLRIGPAVYNYDITTHHYHANVPATDAQDLPIEIEICERKLDFGHGVDGFPNYWADITKCIYINEEQSGGALSACDVPPSFFDVGDDWTVVDNNYGSGARDVEQRFAGCTTHNPADWPPPRLGLSHPTGIEVGASSVRVPCGFHTSGNDQGGLGSVDARSGFVRIQYVVPSFSGF